MVIVKNDHVCASAQSPFHFSVYAVISLNTLLKVALINIKPLGCALHTHPHKHNIWIHMQFVINMSISHSRGFLLKALCNLTKGKDEFLVWGAFIKFWLLSGLICGDGMFVFRHTFCYFCCLWLKFLQHKLRHSAFIASIGKSPRSCACSKVCCCGATFYISLQQEAAGPFFGLNRPLLFSWPRRLLMCLACARSHCPRMTELARTQNTVQASALLRTRSNACLL